jgi:hypothetical protein
VRKDELRDRVHHLVGGPPITVAAVAWAARGRA